MSQWEGVAVAPIRLLRYVWILLLLWTTTVGLVLTWELIDEWDQVLEVARSEGRGVLEKDSLFRRWNADQGDVYVAVSKKSQPHAYLKDLPERDVVTASGRRLTLVSPRCLPRQAERTLEQLSGLEVRITSRHPIRPKNAPDAWEAAALGALEQGEAEVSSRQRIGGKSYMRMIHPIRAEAACAKCHHESMSQAGEVCGGISVAVPMAPLWSAYRAEVVRRVVGYGALWLVGLAGIFSATRRLRRQIGRREEAEQELRKAHGQLVRQTRLATIGQLSASIAHELRNPLGVIRNAVFLLKRKLPREQEKWHDYLGIIEDETATADQIIHELMAMSRGKPPDKEPVELCKLMQDAMARLTIPEAIRWCSRCEPDPFVVHADPAQLVQVLRNLFINAIQAMHGSGTITVAASRSDGFDEVLFSDTGPGIPPETREQIFEPLFTTKSKGTGLGLAICRTIVERHHGTLEVVDSAAGAAFRVRLPRQG